MVVIRIGFRLHLASINLDKGLEPSINNEGKLSDGFDIFKVCQCDGLLLCILNEKTMGMVVWNPYLGQTRLLKPITYDHSPTLCLSYKFAIGYDPSSKSNYKILRFLESSPDDGWYEVYYLNKLRSDTIPVTFFPDWEIEFYANGASVKGNTYWFAREKTPRDAGDGVPINEIDFLICFHFTRERFGPRLRLPFHSHYEDCVTLNSVRDEQLAVLYQPHEAYSLEIWITNKIEPDEVSWNVFLAVDVTPFPTFNNIGCDSGSFFVDEEKKVAVVFNNYRAYVIGEGGKSLKVMDFRITPIVSSSYRPIISYVPSLAQIKQHAVKRGRCQIVKHRNTKSL